MPFRHGTTATEPKPHQSATGPSAGEPTTAAAAAADATAATVGQRQHRAEQPPDPQRQSPLGRGSYERQRAGVILEFRSVLECIKVEVDFGDPAFDRRFLFGLKRRFFLRDYLLTGKQFMFRFIKLVPQN